jgi:hypothetical protein
MSNLVNHEVGTVRSHKKLRTFPCKKGLQLLLVSCEEPSLVHPFGRASAGARTEGAPKALPNEAEVDPFQRKKVLRRSRWC